MITVSKFSTGSVQIRPEHVGPTKLPTLAWLITSTRWTAPRPINVYVIQHPKGVVVFDTGQDRSSVTNSNYFPKGIVGWLYHRLAKFDIQANQTFENGLNELNLSPAQVDIAIISHLHQDHIGGLKSLNNGHTKIVVSPAELESARKKTAALDGYLVEHIFLKGLEFAAPNFEPLPPDLIPGFSEGWDIFGDESIIVLPMSGHTPGSLAMVINIHSDNPLILVGDLTYDAQLLLSGSVPGAGNKKEMALRTKQVIEIKKKHPTLTILAAHDPGAAIPSY